MESILEDPLWFRTIKREITRQRQEKEHQEELVPEEAIL